MSKLILVAGATGKQGRALIKSLQPTSESDDIPFRVLALTRSASSSTAQRLAQERHVQVVEGDIDSPESIRKVYEDAKGSGGIWGVFCVLAYPGLGANADGEERQGKFMADLALEYGVSVYIYSSAERGGEQSDETEKLSGRAKVLAERHVQALGERGLPWTILRPGFFLDNYDDFIGSIAVGVLTRGLKEDTKVGVIDAKDIGHVAAAVFKNPEKYKHQILVVIGDVLTMSEQHACYKRATGRNLPSIPGFLAAILLALNKSTQELVQHFENIHTARTTGQHEHFESQLNLCREAYPQIKTVYDWAVEQQENQGQPENAAEWNKVSLWRLILGKL
ncbi:NAD(P)-binding protein [Suillus plorans]|uniref:NAD(P)-binding protein n=1 Tax=Suillus plorans TaxID=116603 RepID=A0A9P7DI96_9AGAM|nr:NAD(P)-binding protein [Suillus plorans]KAG1793845.1 NAD(P)-binding protein [Suillus plorans]